LLLNDAIIHIRLFLVYQFWNDHSGYYVFPSIFHQQPGGLDGCLLSASGQPVAAAVKVGDAERQTYSDGCFFFASLPPGNRQLSVMTSTGVVLTRTVRIIPDQAVALGTVQMP
jgi:hypothetical protein